MIRKITSVSVNCIGVALTLCVFVFVVCGFSYLLGYWGLWLLDTIYRGVGPLLPPAGFIIKLILVILSAFIVIDYWYTRGGK